MAARHCSRCGLDWPPISDYDPCPQCEEATDWISDATAMSKDEAEMTKKRLDFEAYYEKRGPKPMKVSPKLGVTGGDAVRVAQLLDRASAFVETMRQIAALDEAEEPT